MALWPRLSADIVFLQEATSASDAIWAPVPGRTWGSAVATTLAVTRTVTVPGYEGWVIGCEIVSPLGPLTLFSVHSPTSTKAVRRPYTDEVISILSLIRDAVPLETPLVIGGDFNFTLGERHPSESLKTSTADRRALAAIAEIGLVSCWPAAHPDRPLPQTLRWSRNKATPYHCDGILVPQAWAAGLECEILVDEPYMVSDHNPVTACVNLTATPRRVPSASDGLFANAGVVDDTCVRCRSRRSRVHRDRPAAHPAGTSAPGPCKRDQSA